MLQEKFFAIVSCYCFVLVVKKNDYVFDMRRCLAALSGLTPKFLTPSFLIPQVPSSSIISRSLQYLFSFFWYHKLISCSVPLKYNVHFHWLFSYQKNSIAYVTTLQSDDLTNMNSFSEPKNVAPKESSLSLKGNKINFDSKPYSFSVIRIKM